MTHFLDLVKKRMSSRASFFINPKKLCFLGFSPTTRGPICGGTPQNLEKDLAQIWAKILFKGSKIGPLKQGFRNPVMAL